MAWVRLEGRFFHHPKVSGLPAGARLLYIAALLYAGENETDGFVPASILPSLALDACLKQWKPSAAILCDGALWEPCEGGYRVHDYLAYNPSRERLRADRQRTADRVNGWRERHRNGVTGGNENANVTPLQQSQNGAGNAVTGALVTPFVTPPTLRDDTKRDDQEIPVLQAARTKPAPSRPKTAAAPLSDEWAQLLEDFTGKRLKSHIDRLARIQNGKDPPSTAALTYALRRAQYEAKFDLLGYALRVIHDYPGEGNAREQQLRSGANGYSGGGGTGAQARSAGVGNMARVSEFDPNDPDRLKRELRAIGVNAL